VRVEDSEFVKIKKDIRECLRLFGLIIIEWICDDDLLKFVNNMIVEKEFINFFKDIKCKFKNLFLLLKNI